jgi:hypothetical protein
MNVDLPLPTALTRDPKTVQAGFVKIEQRACENPLWHFDIAVPKDCKVGPQDAAEPTVDKPVSLGLWQRERGPADIEVMGFVLDKEIDAADWLDESLKVEGKAILESKRVQMIGGAVGDVLATWDIDGEPWIGRFFTAKYGPRLFLLMFRTPKSAYKTMAEDFFVSIATFGNVDKRLGPLSEPVNHIEGTTPAAWKCVLPQSYRIQPEEGDAKLSAFQAALTPPPEIDPGVVTAGKLSFAIAARGLAKTAKVASEKYLGALKDLGFNVEEGEFVEEPPKKPYQKSWLLVTRAERNGGACEVRCRVGFTDKTWVVAGVIGPLREESAIVWMQNKRALDVVTSTLET